MIEFLNTMSRFIWGIPGLLLILGTGIWLLVCTRGAPLKFFRKALKTFFQPFTSGKSGNNSSYKALCTALAATVGTGNLAGVAGAIAIGGPGAVFWMWVCGLFGMVIKFAEATLSIRFRKQNSAGEYIGGPMYMIQLGLPRRLHWLAHMYCFFGLVASFGIGNGTQINTVVNSLRSAFNAYGIAWNMQWNLLIGLSLSAFMYILFLDGGKRIGSAAQSLIPFAAISYILLCMFVLCIRFDRIPYAFTAIIKGAFTPAAVTGGIVGSAFTALRIGACRGVFTNEAGMGTAAIAHSSAKVAHPVTQGFMGIVEVFIDTLVICTLTALVILCSGTRIPYGTDPGIQLTNEAFVSVCGPWSGAFITGCICLFAIATVLGWGLYGGRCAQYIFGANSWRYYVVAQSLMVVISAVFRSEFLWCFSEILNGLMAIPNTIALIFLSPVLVKIIKEYTQENTCKT